MRSRAVALVGLVALVSATTGVGLAMAATKAPKPPFIHDGPVVEVQILSRSMTFTGTSIRPRAPDGRIGDTPAGGAEYLATHLKNAIAQRIRNSIVVAPGDLIGASPPCSLQSFTTSRRLKH